jgi:hypothetical protein
VAPGASSWQPRIQLACSTFLNASSKNPFISFSGEQRILSAVLTASGQLVDWVDQDNYAFIGAVLGELKLDINGKLLPVFPAHPMTAKGLGKQVEALSVSIACDQVAMTNGTQKPGLSPPQPDASARVYERALYSVLLQELNSQDVKNLFSLDTPDQQLSCNSLGRALARRVVDVLANDTSATLATAVGPRRGTELVYSAI